jgi:benzoyl-CoA reductase/2-hydroxyglutaryl-CoA dehydratase subunit BcrC/BadD/HgdB
MDLPWYQLLQFPFFLMRLETRPIDVDECEKMGLGSDLCTAIRMGIMYLERGISPPPTAIVGLLYPCDGTNIMHSIVAHHPKWKNIPMFSPDPPYFEDEASYEYYASELKRMVEFLEKHTGATLNMNRLREVINETNKQYLLWQEYTDLRRAVPCPHGWLLGSQFFGACQNFGVGNPRATAMFNELIAHAERNVREGKSGLPTEERIRLLWFDIRPNGWIWELVPWLEYQWGACLVMDMFCYCPYTPIDTSSEDSMFKGLAKRSLGESPMVRQARGVADNFLIDIERIVKDYKIDCVIWPGHMGHKDGSASQGLMREKCRELGVPFLNMAVDLFDGRYTSVDVVKDRISHFFTAMGLGEKSSVERYKK